MKHATRTGTGRPLRLRMLKGEKRLRDIRPNERQKLDGLDLLRALETHTASAVFWDPQYRSVLDKQNYGNEGMRQKGRSRLAAISFDTMARMIAQIDHVLKPSGHLFFWIDKFMLAEGEHLKILQHAKMLHRVDLIAWNKGRPGMGRRARCRTEYLVVAQKRPVRAKGIWTDHRLDDCWLEHSDRSIHPHAKPMQLTMRLIRAVTKRGDLVVDPCAGGYGVLEACIETGRQFVGCDIGGV